MFSPEVWLPVILFAVLACALPIGMIVVGWLFGPTRQSRVKAMPYESGMTPFHDSRRRFDVRFYLVAIAFLVFDVELLFLYPWAVAARARQPILRPQVGSIAPLSKGSFPDAVLCSPKS